MSLQVTWVELKQKSARTPNPALPGGVDLVPGPGAEKTCFTELPYPAKGCGCHQVACDTCGQIVRVRAFGQRDDPRSLRLPCQAPTAPRPTPPDCIADLGMFSGLYRMFLRNGLNPDESCQQILRLEVPKIKSFKESHFDRTLHALRSAGVSHQEIGASPFWKSAPQEWRTRYGLRAERPWRR